MISVADTGDGMDEEVKKHVFDKFYQGDESRSTQGNGLGLAMVAKIAEALSAEVTVESQKGKGSAFTLKLKKI